MEFDDNGYLKPYGPIPADLTTLEEVFVRAFPQSATRQPIFERYQEYIQRLSELVPSGFLQWIDGSFVTQKQNPNDIDVLTFVNASLFLQHEKRFRELKDEFARGVGWVDAHFIRVYPEGHRYRSHYESDRIQWLFDWSHTNTRLRRNKGLIELKTY